jgi:hypothetical protein
LKTHDIAQNTYLAPKNVRGSLFLSDYQGFKFNLPSTTMIGDWMDIEVYIDRDLQDDVPGTYSFISLLLFFFSIFFFRLLIL